MMSRRAGTLHYTISLLLLVVLAGIWQMPEGVSAASPRKTGGITISPAFQDITLAPNMAGQSYEFLVTNNTSEPYEFALSAVDFGSLDESGGVLFSGQAERLLNYKYGLSQWISLERDRIVVEPKSTAKVPVTIENKESMTPGGHYGAVLVSPTLSGERPTKVQINQVLSSLLFVKKQGGEIYRLGLVDYTVGSRMLALPRDVNLRFQNAGNVHVIPRGTVTVHDPAGNLVRRGIINPNSGIMLPETFRKLDVPLESTGRTWLPGTYRLSVAYRFDGRETEEFREYTFFYISGWYIAAVIALIAAGAAAVFNRTFGHIVKSFIGWPIKIIGKLRNRA
jgi:hypothetical protein